MIPRYATTAGAILLAPCAVLAQDVAPPATEVSDARKRETAADDLSEILMDRPGDPEALRLMEGLARTCLDLGELRTAQYCAAQVSRARPESLELRYLLAHICRVRGDAKEAREVLETVIRERPSAVEAYGHLADLHMYEGNPRGALDAWEALLRERPDSALALDSRVRILLWDLHDYESAAKEIDRMRAVASQVGGDALRQKWLAADAIELATVLKRLTAERETLRAASTRLRNWTAGSALFLLLFTAGVFVVSGRSGPSN
jgi:tetratricopeptide (TPR) repeat protein